jgi:predicted transcriptional regulator
MSENFPITIDVDEDHVGKVLRTLDTMPGVVTIHLRMAKDQPAKLVQPKLRAEPAGILPSIIKRKITKKQLARIGSSSVRSTIAQALSKGAMHYKIIGEILQRSGLSFHSIHSALTKMSEDKVVERVGPGTYRLTKSGERKYLDEKSPRSIHRITSAYGGEINNRKGLRSLILKSLVLRRYSQSELRDLLVDNDYSSNNMYNVVTKMREEGLIEKDDDTYTITDAGQQAIAPIELEVLSPDHNPHGREE